MDNQYLLIVEISKEDGITIIYNNLIINFEISRQLCLNIIRSVLSPSLVSGLTFRAR